MKSRTDGIRLAKGKYITIIDGDDSLIHKNILYNSLHIANLGNLDVIEFKISYYRNATFRTNINNYDLINTTGIIYQPELRTKFMLISYKDSVRAIQNRNICGKLVKNDIFKKTIINIGQKYTDDTIITYEDTILSVGLFQVAQSYYFMKEAGYYYSRDEFKGKFPLLKEKMCKINNKMKDMGQVKLLQYLVEKTANNHYERQMIYHEIFSIDYYLSFIYIIYHDYEMVYKVLDTMIQSQFLNETQKARLNNLKNGLLKKQNKTIIK